MDLVIKFISNVHHMGSSESTANRITGMSKAAGKFNFSVGASVKRRATGGTRGGVSANNNSRSIVRVIPDCTPEDAAVIGTILFNVLERKDNSKEYTSKKSDFDTAKRGTLNSFSVSDYEELTKEQRMMYAQRMIGSNAPFDYTERSLHIKYGDCMTIYSKTHRELGVKHWTDAQVDNFIQKANASKGEYDVTLLNNQSSVSGLHPGQDSILS